MSDLSTQAKKDFIPLSIPYLVGNAEQYVAECIRDNNVASVGRFLSEFEQAVRSRTGSRHSVLTASGTAALHLALQAVGVKPDQEVIAPSLSFVASINPIRYLNAWPVLCDVQQDNWTIDVNRIEKFLSEGCQRVGSRLLNKESSREVVGVVAVHLYGHAAALNPLLELCKAFKIFLIEDGAESIGAKYEGRPLGALGDIGIVSFNGNKVITSGAGGAVVTNDEKLAHRVRHLSSQAKLNPLEYIHDEIGYNYSMSNLQAALGLAQIEQLDSFLSKKKQIAQRYRAELSDLVEEGLISFQDEASWAESSHWLNCILVNIKEEKLGEKPWRYVSQTLADENIQSRPFWYPLHRLQPYQNVQTLGGEVTESLCSRGVCVPSSVSLSDEQQERVIGSFRRIVEEAAQS